MIATALVVLAALSTGPGPGALFAAPASTRSPPRGDVDGSEPPVVVAPPFGRTRAAVLAKRRRAEQVLSEGLDAFVGGPFLAGSCPIPVKAVDFILRQAADPKVADLPLLLYRPLPAPQALEHPERYIGRLTTVYGWVLSISPLIPYPGHVEGVDAILSGKVAVGGATYDFAVPYASRKTTVQTPMGRWTSFVSPSPPRGGHWVRLYGVFCREGGGELYLVLTKPVELRYPKVDVTKIDRRVWPLGMHEETAPVRHGVDEIPFWLLLRYAKRLGPAGYVRERDAGKVKPVDLRGKARELLEHGDSYRLRYVELQGQLLGDSVQKQPVPNAGRVKSYDMVTVWGSDGTLLKLASPVPLDDFGLSRGDDVRAVGVFYRDWTHPVPKGPSPRTDPLLVLVDLSPTSTLLERLTDGVVPWFVGGAILLLALICATLGLRIRAKRARLERHLRERQGRHRDWGLPKR